MTRSIFLLYSVVTVLIAATASSSLQAKELNEQWTVSFDERMRIESWDNAITLDEAAGASTAYTRTRTRLGIVWSPVTIASFGLRLTNEFRYYLAPATVDFTLHEIFVDQLYARVNLPTSVPLTFTIGRQDIIQGEGFLLLDGGPLDGSRSIYFNAVRLDWKLRLDHTLTAFASYTEETDELLPVIHEMDQALVERPEKGLGLYYHGKSRERDLQVYLLSLHRSDNAMFPYTSTTTTMGGRIEQHILRSADVTAVLEGGFQFGKEAGASRRAWGGYAYVKYRPAWTTQRSYLPVSLNPGLIFLSGDDPETDTWEGWDPMFGRWPKWSESFIYTQIREDGVAWWTNLASVNMEAQFHLTTNADLKLTFRRLLAPQASADSTAFPGGTGHSRGELYIGRLSYAFDQCWSGHLVCEHFNPGDYYFNGADDFLWFRAELMYKY